MAELAVDDERGGEVEEREIVLGQLFPADQEATEAIKPGVRDFHDPAARRMAVRMPGRWEWLGGWCRGAGCAG